MAFKTKTSTVTLASDIVFEPFSELKTEDGAETLVLHIPDFKKDQLRVQVSTLGVLKVSGEKPLGQDGKRQTRFLKETNIPQGCDINNIRAKFIAGQLHVIMPVKAPSPPEKQQEEPSATPLADLQSQVAQNPTANDSLSDDQKLKGSSSGNVFGIGNSNSRLRVQKKVAVYWGVAVVALVAIGAYVAYRYGSGSSSSSHAHTED